MITSLLKKTIKPAIHSLVLLSYLVSFVLPVNVAYAHTEGVSGASIPAPPAPIIKDQQAPQAVPAAPDFGDIAVDKNNPKAPQLDVAPNGVPLVNIRKPDARGLSHNQFEKLNVGTSGIIFNNSTEKNAQSILGGTILGNSALQGQNARIILTEVTGRDTSTIRGYLEVHGKAAELIIVNPNGIDVNGAGFINIPKATLSTGQLQDLSNGKPIQLKVDGGEITIQGKGLDLKGVSQFDIVTRKVNFDGKLYGAEQNTDVSVRAGKQIYDHESRTSQAHDDPSAEAAPVYAIDSSALGGMYAGKIALISTEKGVGVRAPENMASRMSDITILANGDVVLKNAEAQGKLDVKSKSGSVTVEEGKKLHATGPIQFKASNKTTIENEAQVRSDTSIQIKAPETLNRGNIESSGTIQFEGNRLFNRGFIFAKDHLVTELQDKFVNRGHIIAQNGALFGVNKYFLNTPDLQKNGGVISVTGPLAVQSIAGGRTQHIVNDSGLIETSGPNGKMLYRAEHMENRRFLTFAERIIEPTGDSKKGTHVVERYLTSNPDVQPARIYSSADIEFDVSDTPDLGLHNLYSHIYAAKNINVNGDLLQLGDHLQRVQEAWWTVNHKSKKKRWHGMSSKKKNNHVLKHAVPITTRGEAFSAIMQAGGNLNIVTNGVVQTIGTAREAKDEFLREFQPPAPFEDNQRNGFNLNSYVQSLSNVPLYETHLGAGHAYLFETRKQYADPRYVLGSDYFFTRIGPFAGQPFAAKRMGDAFVETRFLRKQIFENGLADRLGEVGGEVELMRQLYDNAVEEAEDLEIYPGIKMTAELISKLKRDIIWMETEIINGEEVLVPRIYLTSSSAKAHKNAGSQLLAKNINIKAGSANLSGLVASTGETIIETDENLTIKDGRVDGKKTFLKAGSTLRNESSHISGDSLATEAQKTEIITRVDHHQHGRSYNETLGPRAIMESRVAPLEMTTEGDLHTVGALLKGKGGINLVTGGNVLHESAKTHQHVEAHRKKFRFREDHIKHQKTEFDSGGEINSFTIGNEHHQGVAMHAKGPIDLTVGGQFTSTAVHDEDHLSMRMKGGNSWRGKYKKHQEKHSKQADENQYTSETGKVNIHATKNVVMEAPYFSSPVGVEVKSEEGKVHLTVSESTSSSHLHQKSASTVWQSMKDKGHQTTTYRMTRANTPDFQASGAKGTQVDVATGRTYSPKDLEAKKFEMALKTPEEIEAMRQTDYERVIASVAQNPETAYVAALAQNPDVNLAFYDNHHHHWSVHQSNLTPLAVATIGVAVTAATMGMAAPAVAPAAAGATATTAAATTAVATTTVATTAASTFTLGTALTVGGEAVLASAATNGIVDTINNKGNFLKAQRNHFRPERLKSYFKTAVVSAGSAGLVNKLDLAPKTTGFMTRVQHGVVRQGVQTAADVVISGESLGKALKRNAPMVMIDAVQGYVAQRIGEWHHGTEEEFIAAQDKRLEQSNGDIESIIFTAQETSLLDSVTHKLMHSALGAGIAAIKHEDIAAGAVAAPLGEMISETYGQYQKSQIQQDYKDGKISVREVSERLSNAKVSAVEVAKVGTAVAALFTGRDVNTAVNAAGNAAENNFVPVLVAGAVIAMQIATAIDVATNCYEFKVAMDKGDVDGAIAAGVAVGMAAVPGQKLIPAPLRKAVHGVVTKSVTRILHSKYGQAAVKAGGELVDAASSKVQNIANRVTDSSLVKGAGKKLEDWGVSKGGKSVVQQAEKGVAEPIDLRVKPKSDSILSASDPAQAFEAKFGKKAIQNMSDHELAQTLANRADKTALGEFGAAVGKQKHDYAEKVFNRYQKMTGQRLDLVAEKRYKNGGEWEEGMGLRGSVKPDLYNTKTGIPYDYKFGDAVGNKNQIDRYKKALPKMPDGSDATMEIIKPNH